jgi:hypothetical protein
MGPRGLLLLFLGACGGTTVGARATHPFPVRTAPDPASVAPSATLYIYRRDVNLPKDFQLRSSALFGVYADRVVFRVGVVRHDKESAELAGWTVHVEDETGRQYRPLREAASLRRYALNWRVGPSPAGTLTCDPHPCVTRVLPGYEAFEGRAEYVLPEAPDSLARLRQLSLVLERKGETLRFTWRFGSKVEVQHHGLSQYDLDRGTILVPGPYAEEAASEGSSAGW